MDWTPGGLSGDVEDRRGEGGGGGGFGFGGGRGLGLGGLVILLVISLITGRNFIGAYLMGNSGSMQQQSRPAAPPSAEEQRSAQLVSFVLDDTQKTWTRILPNYRHAKLVLFRGATYSGCGSARAATGPFYCPQDEKVYIDLGFWNDLKRFGAGGEFAQAYVIAHEIGHHVQKLVGTEAKVEQQRAYNPSAGNRLSVALELQADCYAGVWAHSTEQRNIVHEDDIQQGLQAAAAVGDDHLQKMTQGYVAPESFTHGTSQQRMDWFQRGLQDGDPRACNTFGSASAD
jgi:predicted metalloprotease